MRYAHAILLFCASVAIAAPVRARADSNILTETLNSIDSAVADGSGNAAGNGNDASATGNGNGNTGAEADPTNSFNDNSANGNGISNGDTIEFRVKRAESAGETLTSTLDSIGSAVEDGSGNAAGNDNSASADDNGDGNVGAEANPTNSFNGNSANDNGIANGDTVGGLSVDPTITV